MIAGLIRLLTGAQARWIGIELVAPDGTIPKRIYFANHSSHLDAAVIWAALPRELRRRTRPVAARDYWERGRLRRYVSSRVFRAVLIERAKVTPHSNPLAAMDEVLDGGESLILFPEGTRTEDDEGEMGEFKPGLWHLARKHPDTDLVPVHLENLNRILPKGEFILIPLLSAVTFGAAIQPTEGEEKMAFLGRAKQSVQNLSHSEGAG